MMMAWSWAISGSSPSRDNLPYIIVLYDGVTVRQVLSHADNISPRDIRVLRSKLSVHPPCGFSD